MGGVVGWCWCGNRYIRIKGKWVNPTHLKKCHFLISHHAFSIVLGVSKNEQFQNILTIFSGQFHAFKISHLLLNFAFLSPDFWELLNLGGRVVKDNALTGGTLA